MDVARARGSGREHDLGARDRELGTVVLPHPEERQADLVGQHRLIDDVADRLRIAEGPALRVLRDVAEGVQAEVDRARIAHHAPSFSMHLHATARAPVTFPRQPRARRIVRV